MISYLLTYIKLYDIICMKGCDIMAFDKTNYISSYNKENYKMYQFRVKRDSDIVEMLDNMENRNSYILSLIQKDKCHGILTLKEIKQIVKPILAEYGINDVYLFGSYSRGEATPNSDIDILCERGNVKTLIQQIKIEQKLEKALNKKVDLVFSTSKMDDYFYEQIRKDLIKLC